MRFKRKQNQPDDETPKGDPTTPPFAAFAISPEELFAAIQNGRQQQRDRTPVIQSVREELSSPESSCGTYWVTTAEVSCPEGHRDSLVITSPRDLKTRPHLSDPNARMLGIGVVEECRGDAIFGIYDLDTLRSFVNQLSAAIDREAKR